MTPDLEERLLQAAKSLIADLAGSMNVNAQVRLWDGSKTPLANIVTSPFEISIANAGVIGSIVRSPRLDTVIRHYIEKGIDISGGSLIDFGRDLNREGRKGSTKLTWSSAVRILYKLKPFLRAKPEAASD